MENSRLLPDPGLLPLHTVGFKKFKLHTKASYLAINGRLAEYARNNRPDELKEWEELFGFGYAEQSWLMKYCIDLPFVLCWDWFHCFLEGGVFNHEVNEMFEAMGGKTVILQLHGFLSIVNWPRAYASAENVASTGKISGSGSELLSLPPALLFWLSRPSCPQGFEPLKRSMCQLCIVLEMLRSIHSGICTPDELEAAITKHLLLQALAYGTDISKPKSQYVQHVGSMASP